MMNRSNKELALLVYENQPVLAGGRAVCDQILRASGREAGFCMDMWSYNMLSQPSLQELVANEFFLARFVVVASATGMPLPPAAAWLMESCMAKNAGFQRGLVLCVSRTHPDAPGYEIEQQLRVISARAEARYWRLPMGLAGGPDDVPRLGAAIFAALHFT